MPHQLIAAGLQAREIYPELKKYFYKDNTDVMWEDFLTTEFTLWIDTRSSIHNTLHGTSRAVEKTGILLQIEKSPETSGDDLTCYEFSFEDAVAHLSFTDPSRILIMFSCWNIFECYQPRIMHGAGLDQCEIRAKNGFDPTVNSPYPWPGPRDQQNKMDIFISAYGVV